MARLLIDAIHAYRFVARRVCRRSRCLFAVSCSGYVEHATATGGLRAGLAAMRQRAKACRPGYSFLIDDSDWSIECRDGTVVGSEQLSRVVRDEYEALSSGLSHVLAPEEALLLVPSV